MGIVLTEKRGRVGMVILNRPEAANAFLGESYYAVRDAVTEFGNDKEVGAIVITGAGKHFCAGGDIKRFKYLIDSEKYLQAHEMAEVGRALVGGIRNCPKPVIAMINGVATGAGLSCAIACDFRIVQPSSKLLAGFVNIGLSGDTGSLYNLPRIIGIPETMKMIMTGEPVTGEQALKNGLASYCTEEGKLEEFTMEFASKLAEKSTAAMAAQKKIINQYFYKDIEEYYGSETVVMAELSRMPDFAEAVNAFLEKRKPEMNK